MHFQKKVNGKAIYPSQLKKRILAEVANGEASPAELARRYRIPIQNIRRWCRLARKGAEPQCPTAAIKRVYSMSDTKQLAERCAKQIDQLKASLVSITRERDLLRETLAMSNKTK